MGQDIHMVVQARIKGRWESVCVGFWTRCYPAFDFLREVAGIKPEDVTKLPDDFEVDENNEVEVCGEPFWMGDGPFGTISADLLERRLLAAQGWREPTTATGFASTELPECFLRWYWDRFFPLFRAFGVGHIRIVFGFDS